MESFSNWFRKRCREAGLERWSIHSLRKAGAARLAEHGATADEIAAFLAHSNTRQAATCTKAANKVRLAESALSKLGNVSDQGEKLGKVVAKPLNKKGE